LNYGAYCASVGLARTVPKIRVNLSVALLPGGGALRIWWGHSRSAIGSGGALRRDPALKRPFANSKIFVRLAKRDQDDRCLRVALEERQIG
jgi:hypothetical protein